MLELLVCCAIAASQSHTRRRGSPAIPVGARWESAGEPLPSTANCSVHYLKQNLDHFSYSLEEKGAAAASAPTTFMQRYYVYDTYWARATDPNAPIFFYAGNEADVGLYVNATGLMWENAKAFGALMIFAEHRFYGASQPKPGDSSSGSDSVKQVQHPYLSHELVTSVYACGLH